MRIVILSMSVLAVNLMLAQTAPPPRSQAPAKKAPSQPSAPAVTYQNVVSAAYSNFNNVLKRLTGPSRSAASNGPAGTLFILRKGARAPEPVPGGDSVASVATDLSGSEIAVVRKGVLAVLSTAKPLSDKQDWQHVVAGHSGAWVALREGGVWVVHAGHETPDLEVPDDDIERLPRLPSISKDLRRLDAIQEGAAWKIVATEPGKSPVTLITEQHPVLALAWTASGDVLFISARSAQ